MPATHLNDFIYVAVFTLVGIFFIVQMLMVSRFLAPRRFNEAKVENYECGNISIGEPWVRFHVGYYVFALLFVAFDVGTVFLFPWAVVFRSSTLIAFLEMAIFVGILILGLFYAWKKGALRWV